MKKPDPTTCANDAGLFCPQCGRSDQLDVTATVVVRLTPDGSDADIPERSAHEWHDESSCSCIACGHDGIVGDFDPDTWVREVDPDLVAANLAKLPVTAFVQNTMAHPGPSGVPPVIGITRGESGYNPIYTRMTADELNTIQGVTPAQAKAMYNGSLFGWDAPAADPDNKFNQGEPS